MPIIGSEPPQLLPSRLRCSTVTLTVLRRSSIALLLLRRPGILWCTAILIVLVVVVVAWTTVRRIMSILSWRRVWCRTVTRSTISSLLAIVFLLMLTVLSRPASILLLVLGRVLFVSTTAVLVMLLLRRGCIVVWLLAAVSSLLAVLRLALSVCSGWWGRIVVMAWGAALLTTRLVRCWRCGAGICAA
jgi:hypothetical protein